MKDKINSLLDIYNDYSILYKMFGDLNYKEVMDVAIEKLRSFIKIDGGIH